MFKNMKLGFKIAAGFAVILILATVLGGFCVLSMKNAQVQSGQLNKEFVPASAIANIIEKNTLLGMLDIRSYALTENDDYLITGQKYLDKTHKSLNEIDTLINKYTNLKSIKDYAVNAEARLTEYEKLVNETKMLIDKRKMAFVEVVKIGTELTADIDALFASVDPSGKIITKEILSLIYQIRMAALKTLAFKDLKYFNDAFPKFDIIYKHILKVKANTNDATNLQLLEKIKTNCDKYKSGMKEFGELCIKLQEISKVRNVACNSVLDDAQKIADASIKSTQGIASTSAVTMAASSILMIIGLIASIIFGAVLAWLIVVGITKPINRIIAGLNETAEQVTSASGQLSSSSQQLAEGSAEQAASIEETSSTLEESASMIRQNTENTRQAALLAKKTKESADKGNIEMKDMMSSMGELKKSSDEIAKIIKVIDDIAFQTNILALNAAVEAARAGEAGMGFAVVAEEVRNLAQRSAQAAKDTASIIESNIELSEKGVDVSGKVNESLSDIYNEAQKVNELLDEIAAASQEQAQGIAQINKAISQMEQVVQSNAATAQESSASSQELSSQAMNMKDIVNSLVQLVNGTQSELNQNNYRADIYKALPERNRVAQNNYFGKSNKRFNSPKSNLISSYDKNTQIVNPEEVIPLENDTQGF